MTQTQTQTAAQFSHQQITPAEAMFALYRSAAENEGSIVYNVPDEASAVETARGTVYLITSPEPRCPEERVIFARDEDDLPYIVDVED